MVKITVEVPKFVKEHIWKLSSVDAKLMVTSSIILTFYALNCKNSEEIAILADRLEKERNIKISDLKAIMPNRDQNTNK